MTTIEKMFNELIDDSRNGGDWETSMANIVIWANALQAENAKLVSLSEQIADLMKSIPSPEEVAALQAENERLRAELEAADGKLTKAIDWLDNAPISYANGVTYQGIDEGEVVGWAAHKELLNELRGITALVEQEQQEGWNDDPDAGDILDAISPAHDI